MANYLKQMVHQAYAKYLACLIKGEEIAQQDIYNILRTSPGQQVKVSNAMLLDFCKTISDIIEHFSFQRKFSLQYLHEYISIDQMLKAKPYVNDRKDIVLYLSQYGRNISNVPPSYYNKYYSFTALNEYIKRRMISGLKSNCNIHEELGGDFFYFSCSENADIDRRVYINLDTSRHPYHRNVGHILLDLLPLAKEFKMDVKVMGPHGGDRPDHVVIYYKEQQGQDAIEEWRRITRRTETEPTQRRIRKNILNEIWETLKNSDRKRGYLGNAAPPGDRARRSSAIPSRCGSSKKPISHDAA